MCFTVITATMEIQKEQCAAEYHWQLRAPAITAKNALDDIEFFLYSADEITVESWKLSSELCLSCKRNKLEEHKQVTVTATSLMQRA